MLSKSAVSGSPSPFALGQWVGQDLGMSPEPAWSSPLTFGGRHTHKRHGAPSSIRDGSFNKKKYFIHSFVHLVCARGRCFRLGSLEAVSEAEVYIQEFIKEVLSEETCEKVEDAVGGGGSQVQGDLAEPRRG